MIITQTPLRISLAGGGTDFPDYYLKNPGLVISTAIDKYIYVIVKERFDDYIYVSWSKKKEVVQSPDEVEHELVREALKKVGINERIEVTLLADIPSEGSGLGSSSSLTVGLLNAFYLFKGMQVGPEQLASEACEIEIKKCHKPIGKQDQYIAAYGGLSVFTFNSDRSVHVERLNISHENRRRLDSHLLLFFTNQTRQGADILKEQRDNIPGTGEHLTQIRELAHQAHKSIQSGKLDQVGTLLDQNWMLKKRLAKNITNGHINAMYESAKAAGATGGKIAGAGGGGFLLLYCPLDKQVAVRAALKDYRELPFTFDLDGSKAIFNIRRLTN